MWTVLGHAASQGFRLLSNLILTRLLFPEVFGVMAIVQVIITGLIMFSDVGIIPSIIRSRNVDNHRFLNTAWTIQCIRNIFLWLMTLAISLPIANFYNRPELSYLIPLAAMALLMNGLFPIKVILASRSMNQFKVTVFKLAGQVSGSLLSILLAFYYKNALVLVAGTILAEGVCLMLYRRFLKGENNKFDFHKPSIVEIIGFGKWIFLASICGFISSNANVFILGKYLKPDVFGIYTVALVLALLPLTVCSILRERVLLPLFSEMDRNGINQKAVRKARYVVLFTALAVTLSLMFISPWFFSIMYDVRYNSAGYMSLIVLIATLPEMMLIVTFNKLVIEGRGKAFALLKVIQASLLVTISLLLVEDYGILGACVATFSSGVATYCLLLGLKGIKTLLIAKYESFIVIMFLAISSLCVFLYFNGLSELLELSQ